MSARLLPAARATWNSALSFLFPESCQVCHNERATPAEGYVCAACWRKLRFIIAPFCERCGLPFEGEITTAFECANCREMELHFVRARSVIAARGMALDIIHRYKYDNAVWFEPFLANLLINAAAPHLRKAARSERNILDCGGKSNATPLSQTTRRPKSGDASDLPPQSKALSADDEAWDLIVPVPLHAQKLAQREFNQAERLARRLSRATGIPLAADLVRRVEITRTQTRLTRAERAANVRRAFATADGAACKGCRIVLVDDVLTTGATTSACARALLDAGAAKVCVWTLARGLLR